MMMMPVPEGQEEADWDWWTMLGVERPKGGVWMEEWKRLETAVQVGREGGREKGVWMEEWKGLETAVQVSR